MLSPSDTVIIKNLGLQDYLPVWSAMQDFTIQRNTNSCDEIWLLEHHSVFTMGRNGKSEHILETSDIPIINIDRGGQITYHGPGQLVVYLMLDIKRRHLGVRHLITLIEQSIIDTLKDYQLNAYAKKEAPGVYINDAKIAALGLRIKKGCTFHGLSLNIAMDLAPFRKINPCGYKDLQIVQLSDYIYDINLSQVQQKMTSYLVKNIGYARMNVKHDNNTKKFY
ncbi:MAG: lipoyl(octanoyl) transferase LipB [Gammaproteobacteria bacterium]|nr:lipoyl(octanoyl) transferase LipB [Gammaproteobacteria bacterium]